MLRRSELCGLDVEDLDFFDGGVSILKHRSKTDQEGKGQRIELPLTPKPERCPVGALKLGVEEGGIEEGAVFRGLTRHGKVRDGRLSVEMVERVVKRTAELAGLEVEGLSSHSLRAGIPTEGRRKGIADYRIQQITGHKSSAMLDRYTRPGNLIKEHFLAELGF